MCAVWNEISDSNAVRCVIRPKYTSSVNVWQQILIKFFFVVVARGATKWPRGERVVVARPWKIAGIWKTLCLPRCTRMPYMNWGQENQSGAQKYQNPFLYSFFFYNNKFRWVNSFNFIKHADLWVPHIFTHIRMRTGRAGNWNSFVAMEIIAVLLFLIKKHTPAAHVICVRRTSMHGANRKNLNASHM